MNLFGISNKKETIYQKEVMDGTKVDSVRIKASSADIQVTRGTSSEVEVILEGEISERFADNLEFTVEREGSLLEIKVELKASFHFGVTITDLKLFVSLPAKVYNDIYVKSSSGDTIVNNVTASSFTGSCSSGNQILTGLDISEQLILKGSSGNIILNNNHAGSLMAWISSGSINVKELSCNNKKLEASSGQISMQSELLEGDTECKVSSGNIIIQSGSFNGNLDIRATSGNVDIYSKKYPEDLRIDCQKTSGRSSINVEGLTITEHNKNRLTGVRGEAGGSSIKADTTSGNVTIG